MACGRVQIVQYGVLRLPRERLGRLGRSALRCARRRNGVSPGYSLAVVGLQTSA